MPPQGEGVDKAGRGHHDRTELSAREQRTTLGVDRTGNLASIDCSSSPFITRMQEILRAELLPPPKETEVLTRLRAAVEAATCVRAAVAYWTINPALLGDQFAVRLAHPDSFLCVDIHRPTSIDHLAVLAQQGAWVGLHLKRLSQTKLEGLPPYLLHGKAWLFDLPEGIAELWVGSHNGTQRALLGPNLETSLVVRLARPSSLYNEALSILDSIRRECRPLDPGLLGYYKRLQGPDEPEQSVLEIEADSAGGLAGQEIRIFGSLLQDLKTVGAFERSIWLSVIDAHSGREQLYRANVRQFGELDGVTFPPHRFALRTGAGLPRLGAVSQPSAADLQHCKYFVKLLVSEIADPALEVFEPLEVGPWVAADECVQDRFNVRAIGKGRPPEIQVPRSHFELQARKKTLDQKRGESRNLIEKKVIRRRRDDDL